MQGFGGIGGGGSFGNMPASRLFTRYPPLDSPSFMSMYSGLYGEGMDPFTAIANAVSSVGNVISTLAQGHQNKQADVRAADEAEKQRKADAKLQTQLVGAQTQLTKLQAGSVERQTYAIIGGSILAVLAVGGVAAYVVKARRKTNPRRRNRSRR